MPFPYVPVEEFRDEYGQNATALGFDSDAAFQSYLTRLLKQESERVEGGDYADGEWRTTDVPVAVYEAVVRLTRARVDARTTDALSSEQSASGRSESYRSVDTVRQAVQNELRPLRNDGGRNVQKTHYDDR